MSSKADLQSQLCVKETSVQGKHRQSISGQTCFLSKEVWITGKAGSFSVNIPRVCSLP